MSRPVITLLTDFGLQDSYVASMKGQILKICPHAQLVDISHEIAPHDIRAAGFQLEQVAPYFPDGTVHLAVVDPGVGTSRSMLAVRTPKAVFVAPDNGLLSRVLRLLGPPTELVELPVPEGSSATFHGRDVMAPAAAKLAAGAPVSSLGSPREHWMRLDDPAAEIGADKVTLSVLDIDRFGNVTFNLSRLEAVNLFTMGSSWSLQDQEVPMRSTYGEVEPGQPLLLWGSHDLLELACREGRGDSRWGLQTGQRVELFRR